MGVVCENGFDGGGMAELSVGKTVYCGGRKGRVTGDIPGHDDLVGVSYDGEAHRERRSDLSTTKPKAAPKKKAATKK